MTSNRVGQELARLIVEHVEHQKSQPSEVRAHDSSLPFSNIDHSDWSTSVNLWLTHGRALLDSLPGRLCPVCDSGEYRHLFVSHDGYDFGECRACGCWFVPRMVTGDLFERFLDSCEEARTLAEKVINMRLHPETSATDRSRLESYFQKLSRVFDTSRQDLSYLDVGCNVGHSVAVASEFGFHSAGFDIHTHAVEIGRAAGRNLHSKFSDIANARYDLISFWETLEHMASPAGELRKYRELLKPSGLIALTVPNLNALAVRMQRGDCPYLHGGRAWPGHINWFNVKGLEILLERAGLSILSVDGQYGHNVFDLTAYLLGESKGAMDRLESRQARLQLQEFTTQLFNSVGPAISILERLTLTTPIIQAVVCRTEDRPSMSQVRQQLVDVRLEEISSQAKALAGAADQ